MTSTWTISSLGDRALVVRLGDRIDRATFDRVQAFAQRLEARPVRGLIEYVPAFTSLTIHYDPGQSRLSEILSDLERLAELAAEAEPTEPRRIEIPACYGGPCGPDLEHVAQAHDLTCEQVIEIHSGCEYLVHMLGFAPGFPYLGGLSPQLATPRRETPRLRVPAGSLGIAGGQTGIYSLETPGGWQLIGRTPRVLFRPDAEPPTLLRPGDLVRFVPITANEFHAQNEHRS